MSKYEYRVIAAPRKAARAKGARTPQDKFARTLTDVINGEANLGWEFQRAESLPVDEKKGMLSAATESYHSVLVFRREIKSAITKATPRRREAAPKVASAMRLGPADSAKR